MLENRKIIHLDMDAFFASVEQRDRPELRGKPLIIGGAAERRGVVSTCSYAARVFGVHSAMPTATARRLCPQGIFLDGDMAKYKKASEEVFAIFYEFTDLVEPMSIDEAFLDVTVNLKNNPSATRLAAMLQREIYLRTGLTASAGVSYNKFLAKVASGLKKPAGLSVIRPDQAIQFLENLPVEKFYGIGKVTAAKLQSMNVRFGRDLKALDQSTLLTHFGKFGAFYYNIVRGIDDRAIETHYERKSYGREVTFPEDIQTLPKINEVLDTLAQKVSQLLQRHNESGKTVTLKIRYSDFTTATRSLSLPTPISSSQDIRKAVNSLLVKTEAGSRPVRLLGVAISNLGMPQKDGGMIQLLLPFPEEEQELGKTT